MKNLKYIYKVLYIILFFVTTFSCDKTADLRMPDIIDGFLPHITADLEQGSPLVDLDNLDNVVFVINIAVNEQYTKTTAQSFDLVVNYKKTFATPGTTALLKTDVTEGDAVTVTYPEVRAALGIDDSELELGDQFFFGVDVTLTNGTKFPAFVLGDNAYSDDVNNIPGSEPYAIYPVACEVLADFTGDYILEQISGPELGVFDLDILLDGEIVTLSKSGVISRTFNFTYYTFTNIRFNFDFVCDEIVIPKSSSGIGCGGPTLGWVNTVPSTNYDTDDDSEILFSIVDNVDRACDGSAATIVFKLTKQ
jgi:hypothetical protein